MIRRIGVLVSGRGSNLKALVEAIADGRLNAEIGVVISDRADAPALEYARQHKLPTEVSEFPTQGLMPARRRAQDHQILKLLSKHPSVDVLVLAGYRRILSPVLIDGFRDPRGYTRIVNIHPSLLPAFPGLGSYQAAFDYGVRVSGVTVHLVENDVDSGPILAQQAFSLEGLETALAVEAKGLEIEHSLYAETLEWFLAGEFDLEQRAGRLCVRPR